MWEKFDGLYWWAFEISAELKNPLSFATLLGDRSWTFLTFRACFAHGQSRREQVSCSKPCAELKWRRVGNSQCSLLWTSLASLSGGKERRGNPCFGIFDIKLVVNVSSNWSLQWGEIESVRHKNSIGSHRDASRLCSSWVFDSHLSSRNPLDSPSISRYRWVDRTFANKQTGNVTMRVNGFLSLMSSTTNFCLFVFSMTTRRVDLAFKGLSNMITTLFWFP